MKKYEHSALGTFVRWWFLFASFVIFADYFISGSLHSEVLLAFIIIGIIVSSILFFIEED